MAKKRNITTIILFWLFLVPPFLLFIGVLKKTRLLSNSDCFFFSLFLRVLEREIVAYFESASEVNRFPLGLILIVPSYFLLEAGRFSSWHLGSLLRGKYNKDSIFFPFIFPWVFFDVYLFCIDTEFDMVLKQLKFELWLCFGLVWFGLVYVHDLGGTICGHAILSKNLSCKFSALFCWSFLGVGILCLCMWNGWQRRLLW